MSKRLHPGTHDANNESSNFTEYTVEKRVEGTYRRNRILFNLAFIILAISIFPLVTVEGIGRMFIFFVPVWLGTICLPFYKFFSRYVNIEYSYCVIRGEFQMDIVYGQRKRKEVMSALVRDMKVIRPYDEQGKQDVAACEKVYDCSISQKKPSPDVYYFIFDDEGVSTGVIFEATNKTMQVMKFYNAAALTIKPDLRH